jgi:Holliday junction resolvase
MKGYRAERNVKLSFIKRGWKVVRAGGSLGEYDIIAFKNGTCIFLQIKSTNKNKFYYYGYMEEKYAGFPFKLVVHFNRGRTVVVAPQKVVSENDGEDIDTFIEKTGV